MIDRVKQHKLVFLLLFLILILGIVVRLEKFSEVSFWSDDMSAVPGGLYWFYPPYEHYPGVMSNAAPPLGHMVIGAGCMLSGEDFSLVKGIRPVFYPGRESLVGEQMARAEVWCHLPMVLFGLLAWIALIVLAFVLVDRYAALFVAAFYAFYPPMLELSRWIKEDIILIFFVALGFLFLYKAWIAEKHSRKELFLFIGSSVCISLAQATKWYAAIFMLFIGFILLEKYRQEVFSILKKFEWKLIRRPLMIGCSSFIAFAVVVFAFFLFSWKNLKNTFDLYRSLNPAISSASFSLSQLFRDVLFFLVHTNMVDLVVFILSLTVLVVLLFRKKSPSEKFIVYMLGLFIVSGLLFGIAFELLRVFLAYGIGIALLMGLVFSERSWLWSVLKNRKVWFSVIMIVYIVLSFTIAHRSVPYFVSTNPIICTFAEDICTQESAMNTYASRATAEVLSTLLTEQETFLPANTEYFYLRQGDSIQYYAFLQSFRAQVNREPTLVELVQYFRPDERILRYVVVDPAGGGRFPEEFGALRAQYTPVAVISLNGRDAAYVYDLANLTKK